MQTYTLPLFPLNVVLCPGGVLPLRVFEAKYLDMVRQCLRDHTPFGIVTRLPEADLGKKGQLPFTQTGISMDIVEANPVTEGLLLIRCVGKQRIKVHAFHMQNNGSFTGEVSNIPDDLRLGIPEDLQQTSHALQEVLTSRSAKLNPIEEPYQLSSASWVSNRWVEILDIPLLAKQRLMQLDSPIVRLELIQDILNPGYVQLH